MQDITWREGTEREVSGETEELRTRSNKRPIACNMGSDGGGKMKPTERSSHLFLSWTSMECFAPRGKHRRSRIPSQNSITKACVNLAWLFFFLFWFLSTKIKRTVSFSFCNDYFPFSFHEISLIWSRRFHAIFFIWVCSGEFNIKFAICD